MYRKLRAPPLRTRRQRGTRGRRTDRRRVHFRWILDSPKRCGFFPFSGLNDIVWIDLLSAVNIPYLNMVDMTDIIYSRIELNWNWIGNWNWIELEIGIVWYWNGHWSGTRNPVWRKSGGESKAASMTRWGLTLWRQELSAWVVQVPRNCLCDVIMMWLILWIDCDWLRNDSAYETILSYYDMICHDWPCAVVPGS